ncbi:MAG: bifunctional 5,10-methylenetetrahydrofolate dehydrogenase/5,10-methenyltetrahydrofolate cyclohydrolase [Tissierellia bacterium]|nr:bifunctional 5,10-methylenetetrahydrofolate dehydrogenase/5,10-methenyltetrahydrofolate cyclohydrolase [Tissierellia bacterium]
MNILVSDPIKKEIIKKLENHNVSKKLLIISQSPNPSTRKYIKSIIKRCEEFNINYINKEFDKDENHIDILNYINESKDVGGYIIAQPVRDNIDISYLRENIELEDLDCFSYDSLGKVMDKKEDNLPQTARSVMKFIDYYNIDLVGKKVAIANSTNVVGKPLSMILNKRKATVTLLNSKTMDEINTIKNSDIFISAIGKANYFDSRYFTDRQCIIDVGIDFKGGKIFGDINLESIKDMDLDIITYRKGVGSITTLSLLESFIDRNKK